MTLNKLLQIHKTKYFLGIEISKQYAQNILNILFRLNAIIHLKCLNRDAWVAQWLSICLWLRSWAWGPGIQSHIRFPKGSLLLPLPTSLPLSVRLSWINKIFKGKKKSPREATGDLLCTLDMGVLNEVSPAYCIWAKVFLLLSVCSAFIQRSSC